MEIINKPNRFKLKSRLKVHDIHTISCIVGRNMLFFITNMPSVFH